MRTPNAAHPQMREVMIPLLRAAQKKVPVVFDDIIPDSDKSLTDYLDATNSWNEIGEYGLNNDIVSLDYMVLDKQK
jgi:thymidylate synthase ThyX